MEKKDIKYIAIEPIRECFEDDEIDLKELFESVKKYKKAIFIFTITMTLIAIFYTLFLPNIYVSKTILVPKQQEKAIPGTASALASIAGINIGNESSSVKISKIFQELLNDFSFNRKVIIKHNLLDRFREENMLKNMVFVFNFKKVYEFFFDIFSSDESKKISKEEKIYSLFKKTQSAISISDDKRSNLIVLKAKLPDRFLAKDLVEIYLMEMSDYVKKMDLENIESQMKYYQNELSKIDDIELKENILNLISNLIKRKVLSQSGKFYMVKQLTEPKVAFIKDKVAPKRSLIVIVTFVSAFLISIFGVFLVEFLKINNNKT